MKNLMLNKTITMEAGKRQSQPCIRGLRITVYDIIGWLDNGMTIEEIVADFPEINKRDIIACSQFIEDKNQGYTSLKIKS